jgi:hypothetical protein
MDLINGQIYPLMKKMIVFKYKRVRQGRVCSKKNNKILKKKREKYLKN